MPSTFHVNRRLSDASLMFPFEFKPVGSEFFPEKSTDFLSDQYAQFSKGNLLGLRDASPLADASPPQTVDIVYDADKSFAMQVYGLKSPDKWLTSRNADPSLTYEQARVMTLTSAMRVRMEYLRINQRLRSTALMTQNKTLLAAERWDNYGSGSSLPITLLQQYGDLIADGNQGRRPNKAVCAIQTLRAIGNSEQFKDLVKFNKIQSQTNLAGDGGDLARQVEALIGLPSGALMVHDAVYNVGGLVNPLYKKFIGSDFVMAYVEPLSLQAWTATVGWRWSALGTENSIIEVPDYTGVLPTTALHIVNATEPQIVKPELAVLIKGCVDTTLSANAALD